jgi:hypothetical protein
MPAHLVDLGADGAEDVGVERRDGAAEGVEDPQPERLASAAAQPLPGGAADEVGQPLDLGRGVRSE